MALGLHLHRADITAGARLHAINVFPSRACRTGLLVANETVMGFWLGYGSDDTQNTEFERTTYLGIHSATVLPYITDLHRGLMPELQLLDVEFSVLEMSDARTHKVSNTWIGKVESDDSSSRRLLQVKKLAARSQWSQHILVEGDVLLTLNGELITWFSQLDTLQRAKKLIAHISRSGVEMDVEVSTIAYNELQTDVFVQFCGAVVQKPHYALKQLVQQLPSEVYVSSITDGSPAQHYGLKRSCFITAVNYKPTPDIKTFVDEVKKAPGNTNLTLKVVGIDSTSPYMVTLKTNSQNFPLILWNKDAGEERGWVRRQ